MLRRSLTPRSEFFLDRNFFIKNPAAAKFSDVMKSGKCLRCYGDKHLAANCMIYRLPALSLADCVNQLFTNGGQNELNSFLAKSSPAPSKAKNHLAKFRYPRVDPEPNVDNRSEQEKLESVLRTLNQILNQDQLDV